MDLIMEEEQALTRRALKAWRKYQASGYTGSRIRLAAFAGKAVLSLLQ